jgi:phosphatidylserine/phosphatidylglycerophosphate/cardiolipin synthase-like enzyme
MTRFEGPLVRELDAVFITDWYSETDDLLHPTYRPVDLDQEPGSWDAQVVPSGPSFDNDNNLKLFAAVIQDARHRVSITRVQQPRRSVPETAHGADGLVQSREFLDDMRVVEEHYGRRAGCSPWRTWRGGRRWRRRSTTWPG